MNMHSQRPPEEMTEELSLAGLAVAGPGAAIDKVTEGEVVHG
ncbi:MAG TPA: hypothetical protein VFJ22_15365 [Dermatophilaceae bacterium]|jgi:hypothetical protein|nr:hypothetical protein [Dermatophilaceae bacterium]